MLIFVGLIILVMVLLTLTPVQNYVADKAASILSDKLKTRVEIDKIRIDFLNHVRIQGLYVEDRAHDTLLYAGEAQMRITDWFLFRKEVPVLRYVGLKNAYVHLYRKPTVKEWNYQFIVDAFATDKPKTEKKTQFEIDLRKIELENVRFHMDDAYAGNDMDFDIGYLLADANSFNFKKKILDVATIELNDTRFYLRDYEGGGPRGPKAVMRALNYNVVDTTPFNKGGWAVKLETFSLENCVFKADGGTEPPLVNEFDPEHMDIRGINIEVRDLNIIGDTLTARLEKLTAHDRSGIQIKHLEANVSVSPNATICDELYLETNNSVLRDYYAMHYERFPDFQDYVNKVVMVANFDRARVDARDVAYFAPTLRRNPVIINASGFIGGSVDSLNGQNLNITDGSSTVKGDLKIIGLPDVENMFIDYRNGEIFTTGAAVMRYAPQLRNNPDIAIEQITRAYFKGNFTGYLQSFAANGILSTNLGDITSNVKMRLPDNQADKAIYSGTVSTRSFNLGVLLREKTLGRITMSADVKGTAFDPKYAQIQLNAVISQIEYQGYNYRNIEAEGILARKQFTGSAFLNDSNLAMIFHGGIDFSQELTQINAKAYLLKSDFQALQITSDSVQATADFDLNFVGNNIDNFTGFARIYNIDLVRNGYRLDVDSVNINAGVDSGGGKLLTVISNDFQARFSGNYTLSTLPQSAQYYVAQYLPNYINIPATDSTMQDIAFDIRTLQIDDVLAVIDPSIKGFNNSIVSGSLNTASQQLRLNVQIPYGAFGNIAMHNVVIAGEGDLRQLKLNADAANVVVGDSFVNGSLKVVATLGRDSLQFNIATRSREAYGTANIVGSALARGDSLYLTLQPSEFYVNNARWIIPEGNRTVFAKNYINIQGLELTSSLQRISISSDNAASTQGLIARLENLDIAGIFALIGLETYAAEGRVNGTVELDSMYSGLVVRADVNAKDVKLGADTLGNIVLKGRFSAKEELVVLEEQSGIFRGDASLTIAGRVSADSTSRQRLDGNMRFTNTPLGWLSPLVEGYLSEIKGSLNGNIKIGGTARDLDIDGKVAVTDAGMRIVFLGSYYTIPTANITVNNREISFGNNLTLYDVNKNSAIATGNITHNRFKNMRLNINAGSSKLEVLNLQENQNSSFYGNLVVGFQNLSVRGPVDDITMRISKARAAGQSHIFIPIGNTSDVGTYSYITFKNYGTEQTTTAKKKKNKLSIFIEANLDPQVEMTLVLDPIAGDAINARGYGNINLEIPGNSDMRMYGTYTIEEGDYTFTFRQLLFKRKFIIDPGSQISFGGLIGQTDLAIEGRYVTRARLYDLLNDFEKQSLISLSNRRELDDARMLQDVAVLLHMNGSLEEPKLTFNIELPEKHSVGTYAYTRLERINQNDRELFTQVASLLLVNTFIPQEGFLTGSTAQTGAVNNVSELLSSTASSQLNNIVNKLLGDNAVSVDLRYRNYNIIDPLSGISSNINRNTLSLGLQKNLFKDKVIVSVGSAYDWGRPLNANNPNSSYLNLAGDFRVQVLMNESGSLRGSIFRTSNYDVLVDRNISRGGVGISWRKTFDNLDEFFHGARYNKLDVPNMSVDSSTLRGGTQ